MPKDVTIVLECRHNDDGTKNAAILIDDEPDPSRAVHNADCAAVAKLYFDAVGHFGSQVEVNESCKECFADLFPQ